MYCSFTMNDDARKLSKMMHNVQWLLPKQQYVTIAFSLLYIMCGHMVNQSFSLCFKSSSTTPLLGFMTLNMSITQYPADSFLSILTLQCSDMPLTFIAALCLRHEFSNLTLRVLKGVMEGTKHWLVCNFVVIFTLGSIINKLLEGRKSLWYSEKYKKNFASIIRWVGFVSLVLSYLVHFSINVEEVAETNCSSKPEMNNPTEVHSVT